MKKSIFALFLALVILQCGIVPAFAEEPAVIQSNHVIVYYFCTNYTCPGCYNIEKWTKEVVDTDFKDDNTIGKIVFKKVCIYAKGNEHFMEDYELCTDSVVLVLIKNDKEVKFTNLTRIWCNICCADVLKAYIKNAISEYLKEI